MCTLTWLTSEQGFELCFNRDEARGRSRAIPPKIYQIAGTRVLMPIDPDGMGTWIAANEYGLLVCLLNDYQGQSSVVPKRSRGQLVKSVARARDLTQVGHIVSAHTMTDFSPFNLLVFRPASPIGTPPGCPVPKAWHWDGQTLQRIECVPPVVSSAVVPDDARRTRSALLASSLHASPSVHDLIQYHRSHEPVLGSLSVCMHRDDASTVSLTHIRVSSATTSMYYYDGAPCRVSRPLVTHLPLVTDNITPLKANTGSDTD
ncbi:NRDE family protein [Salinivibrio kushneri]|uniref:NRDE family protein n=1 Tax=Salinivibrio kushneri TaxID=1908198 RepID=UPI000C821377|nr:NRDE family protein [Salinivibrio kushneri]